MAATIRARDGLYPRDVYTSRFGELKVMMKKGVPAPIMATAIAAANLDGLRRSVTSARVEAPRWASSSARERQTREARP